MNANEGSRLSYPGWRVVAACGIGVFFATQTFFTFTIFLKPLTQAFGWSREAVAAGFGAMTIAAALTAPGLGHLLNRFGLRRIAWVCLAVVGVLLVSLARLTSNLGQFFATFAVIIVDRCRAEDHAKYCVPRHGRTAMVMARQTRARLRPGPSSPGGALAVSARSGDTATPWRCCTHERGGPVVRESGAP